MAATGKLGDRIVVDSGSVGQPVREGEVLEVVEGSVSVRYRVRWADGHESVFTPSVGSARIVSGEEDRKSTRLNSSHGYISYAVFCLKKKIQIHHDANFGLAARLMSQSGVTQ